MACRLDELEALETNLAMRLLNLSNVSDNRWLSSAFPRPVCHWGFAAASRAPLTGFSTGQTQGKSMLLIDDHLLPPPFYLNDIWSSQREVLVWSLKNLAPGFEIPQQLLKIPRRVLENPEARTPRRPLQGPSERDGEKYERAIIDKLLLSSSCLGASSGLLSLLLRLLSFSFAERSKSSLKRTPGLALAKQLTGL